MKLSHVLRVKSGDVIALVGGGGKTTAMFRLAAELAHPQNFRVLTTTTTRIFAAQISQSPAHVTFDSTRQTMADILPHLGSALDKHGQVLLIGQADPASGKAFGVSPETIDALSATGQFDLIINEADGSRMRSFKAPAEHEPVIPACTTLVIPVTGLDVLGQPLNDNVVHRAGLVSRLSGCAPESPISAETIARTISHLQGGLKNVPPGARVIPLLNKLNQATNLTEARSIAKKLLTCAAIEAVVLGTTQQTPNPVIEVHNRIAAIILAAGGSRRFGSPKQLAWWNGQTFLERAVDIALASEARPVIVVLGAEAEQCRAVLKDQPVAIVENKNWAIGQSSSMQTGLMALPDNIGSALFLLVDQPKIRGETVDAVIERYRQTMGPVVWPELDGRRGNPVLFDRALFAELHQVRGDTGGRPLLEAYRRQAERLAVTDHGILLDFDHPRDLEGHHS
jgi:molybdenum cofactor cytidylyltransferase